MHALEEGDARLHQKLAVQRAGGDNVHLPLPQSLTRFVECGCAVERAVPAVALAFQANFTGIGKALPRGGCEPRPPFDGFRQQFIANPAVHPRYNAARVTADDAFP